MPGTQPSCAVSGSGRVFIVTHSLQYHALPVSLLCLTWGKKRHDRTQKPVPPLGLRPMADPKASCRTQDTGVQGNDEQNGQCRYKYTLIQTSFEMTKSSIGSLEITVDWRRVS